MRQGRLTLSNCRARAAWPYRYKRSLQRSRRGSRPLESANGAAAAVSAITAKAKLAGLWREKAEQTNSGPVIVEVNWPNVTAIVYGWSAEVGVIFKALPRICPVLTQRRPLVSCRDWRPAFERLTAKKHCRTRQGQCRPLPVRRPAAIEKCVRDCATAWERSGHLVLPEPSCKSAGN